MEGPGELQAIIQTENRRRLALVAVDLQELDRIFADDLVHVHSTGLVHSKAELLSHIDRKRAFVSIDRGALHIRIAGDVAVMTGEMTNRMRPNDGSGDIILHGFVTQVLRRFGEEWKFISFQLTPIRQA